MEYSIVGLKDVSNSINFKVRISHNDKFIDWNISSLGRSVVKTETIFDQLNKFLSSLDKETKDIMFSIMDDIRQDFESTLPFSLMFNSVRNKTSAFLSYMMFQDIVNFVNFSSDIIIPSSFKDSFVSDITKNITRDKTYTRKDYVELVSLVIVLKSIMPIFAHYMSIIEGEVGKQYKEDYVFSIIDKSIYQDIKPLTKLKTYIEATLLNGSQLSTTHLIMQGITYEEYIDILLARTIIRKLIVSDLGGSDSFGNLKVDDNHNLITYTYKFMTQLKRDNEKVNISDKKDITSGGSSESGLSILEEFRLQQNISIGDILSLEYFIRDIKELAKTIDPTLLISELDEFLLETKLLESEMIYEPQIRILQTLFKKYIPPMSLPHLNKQKILELIALGQTLLWKNNIKILALLLSSTTKLSSVAVMSSTGSKTRIEPELVNELTKLFPFSYTLRNSKDKKPKVTNPVLEDIDVLAKQFSDHVWYSGSKINKIREALQDPSYADNRIMIPSHIRNEIARLFIFCQEL